MPSPATVAEAMLAHWPDTAGPLARIPTGHINETWRTDRHILQRINAHVFPNPTALIRNLGRAVAHEAATSTQVGPWAYEASTGTETSPSAYGATTGTEPLGGGHPAIPRAARRAPPWSSNRSTEPAHRRLLVPTLPNHAGEAWSVDPEGNIWRLFPYIPSRSFDALPDHLLEPAGRAFGTFLARFSTFPVKTLETAIEGFHDLPRYLAHFDTLPKHDIALEAKLIDQLRDTFPPPAAHQAIHGDCKVNNLLFHPTRDEAIAIIDLDTLMSGDPAWDFGDLVRSASTAAERPSDLNFSLRRFERLAKGFQTTYGPIDDPHHFATAPTYMTLMLAVRFLTDHLEGNHYFQVTHPNENLTRAHSQLALAQVLTQNQEAMTRILAHERPP